MTQASVTEQTYQTLRTAILQGRYAPGERLTSVRLANELNVSRTPIRAALARLKSEGLVDTSDGHAAWIPPLTVEVVEEAYEIAEALESMLVARAAAVTSEQGVEQLRASVAAMERAAEKGDQAAWADADEQFHHLIQVWAGRALAASMLERVGTVIDRIRFLSLNLHPEGASLSAREHRSVLEAIESGDAETARDRHAAHLRRVREENVTFLRQSFPLGTPPVAATAMSQATTKESTE